MSRLAVYLFGAPRLELDGTPVRIDRTKAVALLAYLAATGTRHSRDALATLLWPESDQRRARAGLRRALAALKEGLGEGWLDVDRESAGLNPEADLWLDVEQFRHLLAACEAHEHPGQEMCPDCLPLLTRAEKLCRGEFLAGFTLPDSLAFDEWQFFQTEGLRDRLASVLQRLVSWHSAQGETQYEQAIAFARRWLALDPLHEPAQRRLMTLYARAGRRSAALRQYRSCMRVLEEELGVPPSEETSALYQRIRAERARPEEKEIAIPPRAASRPAAVPAFLKHRAAPAQARGHVFVARERQMEQLDGYLDAALSDHGQVVFITGGPGRGKTALMTAFGRRAMQAHPDLLFAAGSCNAYSGIGDPYLPFREIMSVLTGDVESQWARGAVSGEHARRMWEATPAAVQALLDHGPTLMDIFVSGPALLSRAAAAAPESTGWLGRLGELVQGERADRGDLAQSQLFGAYTQVVQQLAAKHPLLLTLDDLQWADAASMSLLFHLGRKLGDSHILVVGAYRPEEVSLGRDGERHPLEKVLAEVGRHFGDVWVDLTRADATEGRRFVQAFLDSEPNRLGEDFREAVFAHTEGHPLFTIELVRAMQERGELVRDEDGRWVVAGELDWQSLPARVEAVIGERVNRLDEGVRDMLALASVEGETFTAQVVAQVADLRERDVLRTLSQDLAARHRLVRELGEVQVDGRFVSRYEFAHALFQGYLYKRLSAGERRLLHGEIAEALEDLYRGQTEEIGTALARHYAEAGRGEKAVEYLVLAGDRARLAYAHDEAAQHYQRALQFLKEQGKLELAARTLMKVGLTYHSAFQFRRARQAYDEGFRLWQRAGALAPSTLPPAPHALRIVEFHPETMDPAKQKGWATTAARHLFSGLLGSGPELGVVPDVARSWEVSGDGRRYVFHLRDDVVWSDGTAVTAADFEFAWKRVLDPAVGSRQAYMLLDIKGARAFHQGQVSTADSVGVQAVDDTTLLVELKAPIGHFLSVLTTIETLPVPRHVVLKHGEAWAERPNIVTNGPFELKAWDRGESIILQRNPRYHGRFTGNVQHVELLAYSALAPSDVMASYEADDLDALFLFWNLQPSMSRIRHRHGGEILSTPTFATIYIGFDTSRPPFDDARVRRAFAFATDRENLAEQVLDGLAAYPATGGFIPPGIPGHSPGIGLPYDPKQARRLLAQAGYPDGRGFPAVEMAVADVTAVYFGDVLCAQWRHNLGVDVVLEGLTWLELIERVDNAPPHVFALQWFADYPDPANFLNDCRIGQRFGWQHDVYEQLAETARSATDQRERIALYQQADRMLIDEAPIVPALHYRALYLVKPWVHKFLCSSLLERILTDVIIEPH